MVTISRLDDGPFCATISDDIAVATEIGLRGMTSGSIHVPLTAEVWTTEPQKNPAVTYTQPAVTPINVSVYVTDAPGGTYRPLYDQYGVAVVIPLVDDGRAYDIPGAAFGAFAMKLNTASTATIYCKITLKG